MLILTTVLFATIIPPLVGDGLRFREMQAALGATHHVLWVVRRSRLRFLGGGKVFDETPQRMNR